MTVAEHDALTETTRTVLGRYVRDLYDARDLDLVSELLADPMYRHDAGGKVTVIRERKDHPRLERRAHSRALGLTLG
jgi:hypothetical protein